MSLADLAALHAAATTFLCGLCWFVQVVHYPLFAHVGSAQFVAYEREHCRRASFVVVPTMLAEVGTAIWLWCVAPPSLELGARVGLVLLAVVWTSTFALQVPCHTRLSQTPDRAAMARLVASNWVRTAAWTLRAGLAWWIVTGV